MSISLNAQELETSYPQAVEIIRHHRIKWVFHGVNNTNSFVTAPSGVIPTLDESLPQKTLSRFGFNGIEISWNVPPDSGKTPPIELENGITITKG